MGQEWLKPGSLARSYSHKFSQSGTRSRGAPKRRLSDQLKATLLHCDIGPNNWETVFKDRCEWRQAIHRGAIHFELDERRSEAGKKGSIEKIGPYFPARHLPRPVWTVHASFAPLTEISHTISHVISHTISHVKSYVELEHFQMWIFTFHTMISHVKFSYVKLKFFTMWNGITCDMDSNVKWFGHT